MILHKINDQILGFFLLLCVMGVMIQPAVAQQINSQTDTILEGLVVDASDDQPLSGVTVKLIELNKEAQTNEDGEFSFQNINPEGGSTEVTLQVNHEGYKKLSENIQLDQTNRVKLELEPQSQIE